MKKKNRALKFEILRSKIRGIEIRVRDSYQSLAAEAATAAAGGEPPLSHKLGLPPKLIKVSRPFG